MNTREAVVQRIEELRDQKKTANGKPWTNNHLALDAGIPQSTLKSIMNGESRNPGIVNIKIICDSLGVSLAEFFNPDAFRTRPQEIE